MTEDAGQDQTQPSPTTSQERIARLKIGAGVLWHRVTATAKALVAKARARVDRRKDYEPGPDTPPEETTP